MTSMRHWGKEHQKWINFWTTSPVFTVLRSTYSDVSVPSTVYIPFSGIQHCWELWQRIRKWRTNKKLQVKDEFCSCLQPQTLSFCFSQDFTVQYSMRKLGSGINFIGIFHNIWKVWKYFTFTYYFQTMFQTHFFHLLGKKPTKPPQSM